MKIVAEISDHDYEVLLDWVMYGGNYTMRKNDPDQNKSNKKLVTIVDSIIWQSIKASR